MTELSFYPDEAMISDPSSQTDAVLKRLATLSDATRLRLLRVLEQAELGVGELCETLQLPQSTISRHLKVLTEDHWIISRRQGTTNLYRLLEEELDEQAREQWQLVRDQTEGWATFEHDALRLSQTLQSSSRDSRTFFASAASNWDKTRVEQYGHRYMLDAMAGLLPANWHVADLGCGTGSLTASLARRVAHVTGVDNSQPMLQAAGQRMSDFSNVRLVEADLAQMPLDDAKYDAAVLMLVLTYVLEPLEVLQEARRILKPNASLVIVDLLHHDREDFRREMQQLSRGFSQKALSSLCKQAGLTNVNTQLLPTEADAVGPALLLATAQVPSSRNNPKRNARSLATSTHS